MRRTLSASQFAVSLLAARAGLAATPAAFADVAPPEVEACSGKAVGANCTSGGSSGTCQNAQCQKLRYDCTGVDGWDGSGPCGTTSYDCVRCTTGSDPGATTAESAACTAQRSGQPLPLWLGVAAGALVLTRLRRTRQQ